MPVLEAQTQQASSNSVAVAQSIMRRLEEAWNAADGAAFGEPFSSDADFSLRDQRRPSHRTTGDRGGSSADPPHDLRQQHDPV